MPGGCCRCGPFRVSYVPQGMLKPYVLRLLSEKPMHGFEIMEQIFQRTKGTWRPGPSAIYPTLAWLEEKGYVESVSKGTANKKARRPYQITGKGKDAVKDFARFRREWSDGLAQLQDVW